MTEGHDRAPHTASSTQRSAQPLPESAAGGVWFMALGGFLVAVAMSGYLFR